MRRFAALLLVGGCSFSSPAPVGGDDASIDGTPPMPDGMGQCVPWTTRGGHVSAPCDTPPAAAWNVGAGGGMFDTTDGSYVGEGAVPAGTLVDQGMDYKFRLVSVNSFSLASGATLRVVGQYPLMILSWSDMNVAGTIDVSSKRVGVTADRGAGSNRVGCTAAVAGLGQTDGGGGGGGGFGASGGLGGNGEQGNATMGGAGGGSTAAPTYLVAGCDGARGGGVPTMEAEGGASGGAVLLTAKSSITITGTGRIHAGGMGGTGATAEAGGGGGGSGGLIGLDAPTVTVLSGAIVAANGGGAGVGCNAGAGETGDNGEDGKLSTTNAAGGQGNSCTNGNRGGAGGNRASPVGGAGTSSTSGGGGGGGGGGAGYIIVWAGTFTESGALSPMATLR